MKLAEKIGTVLQDFELRQLVIDGEWKLEVVEEVDRKFQPDEDGAEVAKSLASEGTITFSGGRPVLEEKVWLY
ncbi:unnamed protein product [Heligmosomoides polygyrus]|uniref:Argininosuccinate synthase n=1 Tax=Heligmosomoides polygyrus TaxID=6339 RepID=A0A183FMM7_HELPZ|nr:unnamed protein product [Heligmosomoides polygyrus]